MSPWTCANSPAPSNRSRESHRAGREAKPPRRPLAKYRRSLDRHAARRLADLFMVSASLSDNGSVTVLAFNPSNQLAVRHEDGRHELAFAGTDLASVIAEIDTRFAAHTPPVEYY